jgi:hypothetical protein
VLVYDKHFDSWELCRLILVITGLQNNQNKFVNGDDTHIEKCDVKYVKMYMVQSDKTMQKAS